MLVEKSNFSKGDVLSLKLSSGEEIIVKYDQEDVNFYYASQPLQLVLVSAGGNSNQAGISFAPWMLGLSDKGTVPLSKNTVLAVVHAREEVKRQYIEATSGLKVAGTNDMG